MEGGTHHFFKDLRVNRRFGLTAWPPASALLIEMVLSFTRQPKRHSVRVFRMS
jgi:hypothetical protein